MDTGLLRNNNQFYQGFEGEEELILALVSDPDISVHIWIGYLDDMLREPELNGSEWKGFTRDYHMLEGAFSGKDESVTVEPEEYLNDILLYSERQFDEPETAGAFLLLKTFLEYAVHEKCQVRVSVK